MTGPPSRSLVSALPWVWLALVIASQTSQAGQLADSFFTWIFGPGGDDGIDRGSLHFLLQKGYHVGLFTVFGGLLSLRQACRSYAACLLAAICAGAVAESLQLLAAGRSPEVADALLNIVAGGGAVFGWFRYRRS
jgi:VanZ family protein